MSVNEFFTIAGIASLTVAAAAVNIVTNALHKVAKLNQKRTAFITGIIIAYLSVAIKTDRHWAEWILAFINGCLLFCTAMGMNDVVETPPSKNLTYGEEVKEPFFKSWHT